MNEFGTVKVQLREKHYYLSLVGFWPRVRARALRARLFELIATPKRGAARPPLPAHCSFAAYFLTLKNTENLSNLGRPCRVSEVFRKNKKGVFYHPS
jgi:hypothetical protein